MHFNLKRFLSYTFGILMIISSFLTLREGTIGVIGLWLLLASAVVTSCVGHEKNASSLLSAPMMSAAWGAAIAVPFLFSMHHGHPEDMTKFLRLAIPFAAILLCLNLIFGIRTLRDQKHLLLNVLGVFLLLFLFSNSWVERSNVLLDSSEPQTVTADVVHLVRRRSSKRTSYRVTVSYIDSNGISQKADLPLTSRQFSSLEEGDTIQVIVGQGYWDVKHYTIIWK